MSEEEIIKKIQNLLDEKVFSIILKCDDEKIRTSTNKVRNKLFEKTMVKDFIGHFDILTKYQSIAGLNFYAKLKTHGLPALEDVADEVHDIVDNWLNK